MQEIGVHYFLTLIGRKEGAALIIRSGLADSEETLPQTIELPVFWRLCAENILANNDESHGVAREPVPQGSLSVLFMSAKEADTLTEALERLSEAARLIRKECKISVRRSRHGAHFTILPSGRANPRAEIYVECFAVVAHCALRWMTGRQLDPVSVRGAASLRQMGGTLLSVLKAPCARRGAGVTITYGKEDVNAPILAQKYKAWGDQEFESFLALLHEQDDDESNDHAEEPTHRAVNELLRAGLRSQEEVSGALHWSVATLRRRLADEGTNFRRLAAEVRRNQLLEMLATDIPVEDIATKLGLSDDRSLRRVCHSSLGLSPRQYRQSLERPVRSKRTIVA
jgi:AraC-like DNA-binding protein